MVEGQQAVLLFSFVVTAFSRLALSRAAERACSSSLSHGEALLPHTPSNRRTAKLSSSTSCSRRLHVLVVVRQEAFSRLALTGRPRELAFLSPRSLAGSRCKPALSWYPWCRPCLASRHLPVSPPLQGGGHAGSSSASCGLRLREPRNILLYYY